MHDFYYHTGYTSYFVILVLSLLNKSRNLQHVPFATCIMIQVPMPAIMMDGVINKPVTWKNALLLQAMW